MDLFNKIRELISNPGAFCLFWTKASGFFYRRTGKSPNYLLNIELGIKLK